MPGPREAAEQIIDLLADLRDNHESGAFVDIRKL
jgi:hypothetical protein